MRKKTRKRRKVGFLFFCLLPFAFFLSSCGAPGDPTPPRPPVPEAVTDLAARQSGDAVALTFTLPGKTVEGDTLVEPPDVEIFRGAGTATPTLVYTIPSALVDTYLAEGRFRFVDPLKPDQSRGALTYFVRTRASKRRASADSNSVSVSILPVPERIAQVRTRVTESAIELEWNVPGRTTSGAPIASLAGYRVYRAEVDVAAQEPEKLLAATPPVLLGVTPIPSYRDTQFEFGHRYLYVVRSVAQQNADSVESDPSAPADVTPRDTFPPAAPLNLVAVLVPATADTPAQVDLSWSISPETDVAGYRVYRSEEEGTPGARITPELLQVPAFRDTELRAGRYFYSVSAVDRAGNESARSAPVAVEIPGSRPTP